MILSKSSKAMKIKNFTYKIGIFLVIFGFLGGCEYLAQKLSCPWINKLTKDQVTCLFGLVFVVIGDKK